MIKMDYVNSWKDSNVFQEQLSLNLKELNQYPQHWNDFLSLVFKFKNEITSILDIGCGCGTYYQLCKKELPNIEYTGIDYSPNAIGVAKQYWKYPHFYVKDFWSINNEYINKFDLIHCGALFDVLPNADHALKHLLSLKPKKVLIGRIKLTDGESYCIEYKAYNEIITYAYYHSSNYLDNLFKENNYKKIQINNNLFLELKN